MTLRPNSGNSIPPRRLGGSLSAPRSAAMNRWVTSMVLLIGIGCESRTHPTEPPPTEPPPTEPPASSPKSAPAQATAPAPTPAKPDTGWTRVGAPVPGGVALALSAVLSAPSSFQGKRVLVEGEVRRTCTKKGCWMELSEGPGPTATGCRVTFKDYGFFVPTDASGSHARLEGEIQVKTLRKGHVDHLEAEGAHFSQKNPDGSALEVQIVASGVELKRS